jgi:hypothetical protein
MDCETVTPAPSSRKDGLCAGEREDAAAVDGAVPTSRQLVSDSEPTGRGGRGRSPNRDWCATKDPLRPTHEELTARKVDLQLDRRVRVAQCPGACVQPAQRPVRKLGCCHAEPTASALADDRQHPLRAELGARSERREDPSVRSCANIDGSPRPDVCDQMSLGKRRGRVRLGIVGRPAPTVAHGCRRGRLASSRLQNPCREDD